jgi:hypothetical protein
MQKIPKRKYNYAITTWRGLHQYPMKRLATHGGAGNHFSLGEIHLRAVVYNLPTERKTKKKKKKKTNLNSPKSSLFSSVHQSSF